MVADAATLEGDQRALFDALPTDGATVGNLTLKHRLNWDTDRYFNTRDALVDLGLVARGRGHGGAVRRTTPQAVNGDQTTVSVVVEPGADAVATVEAALKSEMALYEPMCAVIRGEWARDHRRDPLAVEVTALQGRRQTGGFWSRPDIVSVEVLTFPYVPGKYLEVATFEVKAANAINVQGVYEALAHRRAATHSYVLLHVPNDSTSLLEDAVADVAEAARGHGIGVVTVGDPADYQTWEELEEARRTEPDPVRLNSFLASQVSEPTRDLISRRLR